MVALVIHLVMCYKENKHVIYKVGDLLDLIEFHMWFPILNTCMLIALALFVGIISRLKVSKLDVLWQKFRNIKLK